MQEEAGENQASGMGNESEEHTNKPDGIVWKLDSETAEKQHRNQKSQNKSWRR